MVCRGWHSRTGRRGGRCEVGEAGELRDLLATIHRMRAGTEIWQNDAPWVLGPSDRKCTI